MINAAAAPPRGGSVTVFDTFHDDHARPYPGSWEFRADQPLVVLLKIQPGDTPPAVEWSISRDLLALDQVPGPGCDVALFDAGELVEVQLFPPHQRLRLYGDLGALHLFRDLAEDLMPGCPGCTAGCRACAATQDALDAWLAAATGGTAS